MDLSFFLSFFLFHKTECVGKVNQSILQIALVQAKQVFAYVPTYLLTFDVRAHSLHCIRNQTRKSQRHNTI
jgi:hypothetical protein